MSLQGRHNLTNEDRLQHYLGRVVIDQETGCWFSPGGVTNSGYRYLGVSSGKLVHLHRFVYERLIGPIPEGRQLHHVCRNKECLYPKHLEVLTASEHTRLHPETREKIIRMRLARTHCVHGHELTPENTYMRPGTNRRVCRICIREAGRRHDAKRRKRPENLGTEPPEQGALEI